MTVRQGVLLSLFLLPYTLFSYTYFKYSVVTHDTVQSIASHFNTDEKEIVSRNGLSSQKYLYVGQLLEVPISYTYHSPIEASLITVMNRSVTNWSSPLFELYSWDKSDKVLIFDTINYSFQSLMFKRLAFFVEKKDYIGNIYSLDELEGEKGWNGHDYESKDLARFFNKVNFEGHTITGGEEILLEVLLKNGILVLTRNGYVGKGGAVISCSRSSYYNHRMTILRHEAFHGLFFTSSEFRLVVKDLWQGIDYQSKTIWKMYLEFLEYNTMDEELVMNEFMAYMLQQSEDETYTYLNEIVWFRLWDYFPDKREQINRFFNADSRPFRRQINGLRSYVSGLNIE